VNIPNEEMIRQQQMTHAITLIEQRRHHERVIFFGDFNSVPTNASVRKIASNAGYRHLRAKLSATLITRRTCNTFNGWKITKREGKWIDDVLTSPTVKPYAATIMLRWRRQRWGRSLYPPSLLIAGRFGLPTALALADASSRHLIDVAGRSC
jgi:hypothetical protein